ncbi:MBL fold metallo-hydrolase [Neorhizobium sp. NPDC001467]|uniref:MBL fold metallo-hydrolase n=1 Tax=Neorhizobium sp. NPDC001467 TaxID=3390595 RepID=UPI003D01CFAF
MTSLTRRATLKVGAVATAAAMSAPINAFASDPTSPFSIIERGKHFARCQFGDLAIVALCDGYVDMPPSRLRQAGGEPFDVLPSQVALVDGQLRLSVNAYLIIENDQHLLVDTGASDSWEPTMGLLLDALAEAGIPREAITNVALTHTHTDHVNGLIAAGGGPAFPRLERLFVPKDEAVMFETSSRLAAVRELVVPVDNNFPISDRVTAVNAFGHSIGHTAYQVEAGEERLLVMGDIIHVPSLQFDRPEVTWELDGDQEEALKARLEILGRASGPNYLVAGMHLDFPGIGKVTRHRSAFSFMPLT